ncbi:hypothetical protein GCM10027068_40000 [Prescottella soli]
MSGSRSTNALASHQMLTAANGLGVGAMSAERRLVDVAERARSGTVESDWIDRVIATLQSAFAPPQALGVS